MKKYFIVFSSILLLATFSANAQIIYVKHDATGTNTGNSWENAFTSLQSALGIAVSGDQIWVARGTYKPSYDYGLGGGARYYHFRMIDGVAIYGGFAGTETLVSQRTDFGEGGNNETILSADLNGDDILVGDGNLISISNNSENCYHVFMHPSAMTPLLTNTAILDGFTITGGNADGTVAPYTSGGGILCDKNSPTLNQLIIKYNFAKGGGGITISGDEINPGNNNTKLTNSVIKNNLSSGSGAGVNMANCSADAEVINCTISGNKTTLNPGSFNQGGAGVRIYHRAKFINCIIENNWAPDCTAGGGGAFIDYGTFWGSQGIFFINCTIINNYAKNGGGTNYVITGGEFRNCILWGNTDQNGVSNYIGSSFAYCNTYPLPSGTGNISIYPDFVDPLSKDFRICGNSICVNSGNNAYNSQLSDIRGQVRIQNTTIDMGAYEFTSGVDPIRYYVKHDASGLNNGTTWENAFTSLQSALNVATAISEIWVAKGTYKPSYDYGIGGGLRFNHFRMINGVSIYGGFAGNEISINQRSDFGEGEVNETILSADINDDDVVAGSGSNLSITNNTENCYHVFRLSSDISPVLSQTAILDGFTITGGNADSETSPDTQGGGVVIESQSPLLRNLVIKYNFAKGGGGITMMGPEVNPGLNNTVIQNSVVKNNLSSGGGGGVNMVNCGANAEVVNCIISGNLTTMNPGPWNVGGGGIRIYHRAKFTNCLITNNWAPYCVAGGGGVFIDYGHFWSTLSVIFTGCTIADNYALNYGGVSYVVNGGEFRNCILWGNTDQNGLSNYYGSNYIYCNTTPLPSGAGNISTDPGFVDSGNNDYRLVDISPSVNTGTNGYNAQTYDVRGQARIQGGTIDMGAYEWTTGIDPVATTPEITCPADIYVNNDAGLCTAVVNYDAAVATGTPPPSLIYSHASGSEFPVGTTTVTVTATNIVGVNQCTFEIIVSDAEIPTITCPPNLAINTDTDLCTASGVVLGISITSDNCGVLSTLSDAVEPYAVGTHIITWTVTDASNNSATCQQTVTVTDAQVPTIACPSNVSVNTDADFCTASGVDLGTPTAGDNCSFTVTNDGVEPYAVGTHIITWTVIDASNNSATCEQTLTVTDNQLPVINCPADVLVNTDTDLCTASGVDLGTPTTSDNCDILSVTNDAVEPYSVGVHTITWTVEDVNGNTETCEQTLTVADAQLPVITCPEAVEVNADADMCTASGVEIGDAVTGDNCGVLSVTNDAAEPYAVGVNIVTWTVEDVNGNTNTCQQSVTVIEEELPEITCPANVSVNTDADLCTAGGIVLDEPITSDNCGIYSVVNDAPETFETGETTVIWTVTDNNGNIATCSQVVTVTDNQAPAIVCPPNVSVPFDEGENTASNVDLGTPETSDNCGIQTVENDAVEPYPVGITTVTWTVTDVNGNTATCTQTVTVYDPIYVVQFTEDGKNYISNYPNPFTNATTIEFGILHNSKVSITIVDLNGIKIASLFDGVVFEKGVHHFNFNSNFYNLCPGEYIIQLQTGNKMVTNKMAVK